MSTMGLVSTLGSAQEAANLSVDFINQAFRVKESGRLVSKSLNDLVKVSRPTVAGVWNASGKYEMVPPNTPRLDYNPVTKVLKGLLVEWQSTNLATYSDDMTSTSWTKTACLVNLVGASPMGKAFKVIATSSAVAHFLQKNYTAQPAGTYSSARMLKAGEHTLVRAQIYSPGSVAATTFDLIAGTATVASGTASIIPVGDGWYLCSVTVVTSATDTLTDRWYPVKGTDTSFAGNDVDGYYTGSSQFESGAPTSYIPSDTQFSSRSSPARYFDSKGVQRVAAANEARSDAYIYDDTGKLVRVGLLLEPVAATNLLRSSSNYSGNVWSRASGVTLSDGSVAPDGTASTRITLSGANSHNLNQPLTSALTVGTTYTLSIWMRCLVGSGSFQLAYYDASNAITSLTPSGTRQWKRYSFTFTPSATVAAPQVRLLGYANGVDGDVYELGNVQLEVGDQATSDVVSELEFTGRLTAANYTDKAGNLQVAGINVARTLNYRYTPEGVLVPDPLLIENRSVNLCTYSSDFAQPNWTSAGPVAGPIMTATPAAADGPRGVGTMTLLKRSDLSTRYLMKSIPSVPVGVTVYSLYVKKSGANSKFIAIRMQFGAYADRTDVRLDLATGATVVSRNGTVSAASAEAINMGNGLWRLAFTANCPTALSNIYLAPMDRAAAMDSTPVELSELYVDMCQVESASLSSIIHTQGSSVTRSGDSYNNPQATRAADVSTSVAVTRVGDNPSISVTPDWFNPTAGALVTQFIQGPQVGQVRFIAELDDGSVANRITTFLSAGLTATSAGARYTVAGTEFSPADVPGGIRPGVSMVSAIAWSVAAGIIAAAGGVVSAARAVTSVPAVNTLRLGASPSSVTGQLGGHIQSLQYYPQRLSANQLQMMV